jgi:hypothetical protein
MLTDIDATGHKKHRQYAKNCEHLHSHFSPALPALPKRNCVKLIKEIRKSQTHSSIDFSFFVALLSQFFS